MQAYLTKLNFSKSVFWCYYTSLWFLNFHFRWSKVTIYTYLIHIFATLLYCKEIIKKFPLNAAIVRPVWKHYCLIFNLKNWSRSFATVTRVHTNRFYSKWWIYISNWPNLSTLQKVIEGGVLFDQIVHRISPHVKATFYI